MQGCFVWLLVLGGGVFVVLSLIRWFEQVTEAVERGWWNKTAVLLVVPPAVWFFPSRVSAGRPTPVPRHEPVRGRGSVPKPKPDAAAPKGGERATTGGDPAPAAPRTVATTDGPPPGTPAEFIGLPKIPPKRPRPAPDPDKMAKLRQKMREQGMLPDDEGPG